MVSVLEVRNLSIRRDNVPILSGVNWRVAPGEHWVLLGGNGSGKTSLLAALTGYFMPTSGDIWLLGQKYGEADWRELRLQIGLVSSSIRQMMNDTEPALDTVASGRYAMIDFWGRPKPADRREARRLLAAVEASGVEKRPWAVLSQGERQRVLIARALMARPRLLILDEPCAGLDPVAREHFLQFLSRFAHDAPELSLVLVTHHVEEITPLFGHALLLRSGRVTASGPLKATLTSEALGAVFGARVRVRRAGGRWSLHVEEPSRNVM
jgi:iron complex transport system ATP-binding protein